MTWVNFIKMSLKFSFFLFSLNVERCLEHGLSLKILSDNLTNIDTNSKTNIINFRGGEYAIKCVLVQVLVIVVNYRFDDGHFRGASEYDTKQGSPKMKFKWSRLVSYPKIEFIARCKLLRQDTIHHKYIISKVLYIRVKCKFLRNINELTILDINTK